MGDPVRALATPIAKIGSQRSLLSNGSDSDDEFVTFRVSAALDVDRPSAGQAVLEEEWSVDHAKVLYLISLYAACARSAEDNETWIRQTPLMVLIYEGIVAGVLDFDYAPTSVLITSEGKSRRVWLNVSQEGKSAVDDLREKKLVNGLKLSTDDFQAVTAFQLSLKGLECVAQVPEALKQEVRTFLFAPKPHDAELLHVRFLPADEVEDGDIPEQSSDSETDSDDEARGTAVSGKDCAGVFWLTTDGGFWRVSTCTKTEDVSYVSSPYLPNCVRNPRERREFSSNAHRAHESALGHSSIRDELDEAIVLSHVVALVGEWIPFGSNQIVALNERLGALDRCQGGLFTSMVDDNPADTRFVVDPGLTSVVILDYDLVRFTNFEAEIHFPEDEGIVQIENFGMHLRVDGTTMFGIKVESIMDRTAESISLDHLARLLVDVHQDSSRITNDLLSEYQRSQLEMLFVGDASNRSKYNLLLAEGIEPFLPAAEYLDGESNENELKQVLGDIHNAFDLGEDGVLILGRDGLLVAGYNAKDYEELLVSYLSLLCREAFIRNFFTRTFIMDDSLKRVRALIQHSEEDPNHIARIRDILNESSRDIVLMTELLSYLYESLADLALPEAGDDPLGRLLDVHGLHGDVVARVKDLRKLVDGAENELKNLQQMTEIINTRSLEQVFKNVEMNTKLLVDASAANERSSASLEVMQVILAGSFAFDLVDRISGGTLNVLPPDWVYDYIVDPLVDPPFLWFSLNILWLCVVSVALLRLMAFLARSANGALTLRAKVNQRVRLDKLAAFLAGKTLDVTDTIAERRSTVKKSTYTEQNRMWGPAPITIELQYDEHGFLLVVVMQINARVAKCSETDLLRTLFRELHAADVLDLEDGQGTTGFDVEQFLDKKTLEGRERRKTIGRAMEDVA